jgi:hypothetical protein
VRDQLQLFEKKLGCRLLSDCKSPAVCAFEKRATAWWTAMPLIK